VRYERYEPTPALRDVAEHYWLVVAPAPRATLRAVLVPNGRATVQFCLATPGVRVNAAGMRARNADVFLPATSEPMLLEQDGASHYVGIQFTAWGARRLWPDAGGSPRPVSELTDQMPNPHDLAANPARTLDHWLTDLRPDTATDLSLIRGAVRAIDAGPDIVEVGDLPGLVAASPSTVYRQFVEHVGLSPKRYIAVMRHRRFTDALLLASQGDNAAMLAAAAGYYDESHASREFRRHTGMTAAEFRHSYDGIARLMAAAP
jgi:AraC-like DNA-binding protein